MPFPFFAAQRFQAPFECSSKLLADPKVWIDDFDGHMNDAKPTIWLAAVSSVNQAIDYIRRRANAQKVPKARRQCLIEGLAGTMAV
jgi:hypothetical protein